MEAHCFQQIIKYENKSLKSIITFLTGGIDYSSYIKNNSHTWKRQFFNQGTSPKHSMRLKCIMERRTTGVLAYYNDKITLDSSAQAYHKVKLIVVLRKWKTFTILTSSKAAKHTIWKVNSSYGICLHWAPLYRFV